jgi:hypothetical protein
VGLNVSYYNDYPTEPIGGSNPYHCCKTCKRSAPEINGRLEGHETWCEYRKARDGRPPHLSIPQRSQRQDSVTDQMNDLIKVAERLGMYDAADLLKELVE